MEKSPTIGSKLIMITGCNKGIGFGILKNLAARPDNHTFIMAIRSIENGKKAIAEIEKDIPKFSDRVTIHQVDISKTESIDNFVKAIKESGKKIDCLINNAGIAFKGDSFGEEVVRVTFQTNFYGTVEFTEKMIPYIADLGKIIFIAFVTDANKDLNSDELKKAFNDINITKEKIYILAKQFYDNVVDDTYLKKGWPRQAYHMAGLCQNVYRKVLAKREDIIKRGIQVYSCSPGWVRTDMAGPKAPLSIEEGAICPCFIVDLPWKIDPKLQGQIFSESKLVE